MDNNKIQEPTYEDLCNKIQQKVKDDLDITTMVFLDKLKGVTNIDDKLYIMKVVGYLEILREWNNNTKNPWLCNEFDHRLSIDKLNILVSDYVDIVNSLIYECAEVGLSGMVFLLYTQNILAIYNHIITPISEIYIRDKMKGE